MSDLSMAEPLVSDDGCMAGSKDVSRLYERIADVGAHWDFNAGPGNHYHCSSRPVLKASSAGIWGILVNGIEVVWDEENGQVRNRWKGASLLFALKIKSSLMYQH